MGQTKSFQNKSTQQLQSKLTVINILSGFLIGITLSLLAVSLYNYFAKGDSSDLKPNIVIAFCMLAILPSQFQQRKAIKMELEKRENLQK